MSRAAGGTYTLPAGNPVVTGTIISSTWGNTTLADIATALTDSLSRSGLGGMTAPLLIADGTQALPAYSWTNEPSSGLFRSGAGTIALSLLNFTKASFSANSLALNSPAATNTQGLVLQGTTTGYNDINIANTSGSTIVGVETSAGNVLMSGSTAYSSLLMSNAATSLFLGTNGTARIGITNAGNVTISAPSSGAALTISGSANGAAISAAGGSATQQAYSWDGAAGCYHNFKSNTASIGLIGDRNGVTGGTTGTLAVRSEGILTLASGGGSERISIAAAGNVTINAPSSGVALVVGGINGQSNMTIFEGLNSINAQKNAATYETGTFTGTLTGCTTSPSGTFNWTRVGNVVTIDCVVTIAATSNTTACTITGVPAALNPARNMTAAGFIQAEDNTVFSVGSVQVGTSGTLILAHGTATVPSVTFTAAGTKGFSGMCITYPLT